MDEKEAIKYLFVFITYIESKDSLFKTIYESHNKFGCYYLFSVFAGAKIADIKTAATIISNFLTSILSWSDWAAIVGATSATESQQQCLHFLRFRISLNNSFGLRGDQNLLLQQTF